MQGCKFKLNVPIVQSMMLNRLTKQNQTRKDLLKM